MVRSASAIFREVAPKRKKRDRETVVKELLQAQAKTLRLQEELKKMGDPSEPGNPDNPRNSYDPA
jgi:hypothetical protein